jgi:hypothetical protein
VKLMAQRTAGIALSGDAPPSRACCLSHASRARGSGKGSRVSCLEGSNPAVSSKVHF